MTKVPSVMSHNFSQVPRAEIPRSSFDRSCGNKTTFDAGLLIPVFVDEALPGDTFNLDMTAFARLATPLHPFMDNMYLDSFFFAVPLRLLWDNFERFNGATIPDPDSSTDFICPVTGPDTGGYLAASMADYMGIPTEVDGFTHNVFHQRAYNLIYNEWFRDENLQDSLTVNTDDGPDLFSDYSIVRRGKRHDYFTSCLPWPQKGPAVELPLGTSAPITGIGKTTQTFGGVNETVYQTDGTGTVNYVANTLIDSNTNEIFRVEEDPDNSGFVNIRADLTNATAATINQLRQAFQIQKLYERDARGGTRYTEIIRSHFGVVSPDARLQRPEYLGGGSSPININPLPQSSETNTTPQGTLAATGTVTLSGHGFTKSFTEHCVIIGLVSARADLNYQQGLSRMFSRSTRWDFYWPALSHIGEQAVNNIEIYTQGTSDDALVFGYQERFAEYRYKPSTISGEFRSNFAQSLDTWHLAQDFSSLPVLDDAFIQDNPPVDRVIAVSSSPHFIFDSYFKLRCARPMPTYSVPGLIDHF